MAKHVPELDLRDTLGSIADRMNIVPGFKPSAAFFTFLRANLVLPPSSTSTPILSAYSSHTLPPLHTLSAPSLSNMPFVDHHNSELDGGETIAEVPSSSPLDQIPPLTTKILTDDDDKVKALKLVVDSVAQQRQFAAKAIIFHPLTIAIYIGLMATLSQFLYKTRGDLALIATTGAGVTMAVLIAVRGAASGYLSIAEEMGWSFLKNEDGEEDVIIGSRFGEELIGACVLRLERNPPSPSTSKKKGSGNKHAKLGGKGLIRAWTVRIRYRGNGVGTELLEEAIKITREKLGSSAEVGFAVEHANSKKVLPVIFNAGFKRREMKATKMLEKVVEEIGDGKKRR